MGWGASAQTNIPYACLVSGDANDGIYEANFLLPRFFQFGDYSKTQGTVSDLAGNVNYFNWYNSPSDPFGAFKGTWHRDSFSYNPDEDYWAPVVSGYTWKSPTVNTGKGDAIQYVDVSYSDPAGTNLIWLFVGPLGKNVQPIGMLTYTNLAVPGNLSACTPDNLGIVKLSGSMFSGGCQVSGDAYSGVVRFGFTIPRASASGQWDVTQMVMVDSLGNQSNIYSGLNNPFTNTPTN